MARTALAIILSALLLAPFAQAAALRVGDPARDIMITSTGVMAPVDSIDVLGFTLAESPAGLRTVTIDLVDLSRRGLEDALFVQGPHSQRVYIFTEIYPDNTALVLVALQFDDEPALSAAALRVQPPEVVQLPVEAMLDPATNSVSWRLQTPERVPEATSRFVVTSLGRCEAREDCQRLVPAFGAMDVAPNDVAEPIAVLSPELWWGDIF